MRRLCELPGCLQEIRQDQRVRQEDIAGSMRISRELLSRLENNRLKLYVDRAEEWAALLGYRVLFELEPLVETDEAPVSA